MGTCGKDASHRWQVLPFLVVKHGPLYGNVLVLAVVVVTAVVVVAAAPIVVLNVQAVLQYSNRLLGLIV